MGDPSWGLAVGDTEQPYAVTALLNPHNGEFTTIMKSPRRGTPAGPSAPPHVQVMSHAPASPAHEATLASELRVFADLFAAGQLSPAEYEMCKASVIARYSGPGAPQGGAGGAPVAAPMPALTNNDYEISPDGSPDGSPAPAAVASGGGGGGGGGGAACTLLLCCELAGARTNLELEFPGCPTIAELTRRAEQVAQAEVVRAADGAPSSALPVRFSRVQLYHDAAGTWCDLVCDDQLHDFVQLYAFQTDGGAGWSAPAPSPKDIPVPRLPLGNAPQSVKRRRRYRVVRGDASGGGGGSAATVPLRDGPADRSPCLLWVPDDAVVTEIAPCDGVWRFVDVGGRTGYIDAGHLAPLPDAAADAAAAAAPPSPSPPPPPPLRQPGVPSLPVRAASPSAAAGPTSVGVSVSAHLYGTVATVATVVDTAWGGPALSAHLSGCLIDEARKRSDPSLEHVADSIWNASVVTKLVQRHDPGLPGWVDLLSPSQLQEGSNLFVQLTTLKEQPQEGDLVTLAPGHAPELLTTGCLKHGDVGEVVCPPGQTVAAESAAMPLTIRGPRGDVFVYFKDDVMVLSEHGGEEGGLRRELDVLLAKKVAAVAVEDFAEAKVLKEKIDMLREALEELRAQQAAAVAADSVFAQVAALQERKEAAIAREDYAEAKALKDQLDGLNRAAAQAAARGGSEEATLEDRLRKGMSHVNSSRGLMATAEALHASDPEVLYNVIEEFQPSLSRQKVQRNWRKIIGIYITHAEKAMGHGSNGSVGAAHDDQFTNPPSPGMSREPAMFATGDDIGEQIRGVIDFLDSPLSPRTLREVRTIQQQL